MTVTGLQHTATLLNNGWCSSPRSQPMSQAYPNDSGAELYDPSARKHSPQPGSMTTMRGGPAVTLLSDGRYSCRRKIRYQWPKLYDPNTGTFTFATGSMTVVRARLSPTATLLGNGKVLIVGGDSDVGSASYTIAPTARASRSHSYSFSISTANGRWTRRQQRQRLYRGSGLGEARAARDSLYAGRSCPEDASTNACPE